MFHHTETAPRLWSPRLSLQRWYGVLTMALFALALAVGFLAGAPLPAQAAAKTYPVVVNDHGLRVRERPTTASRHVGSLFAGDRVRIICTTTGPNVKGPLGKSRVWNKIGTNRWVSDAFIRTGSDRAVAPRCNPGRPTPPPPPPGIDVRSDCDARTINSVRAFSSRSGMNIATEPSGLGRFLNIVPGRMWENVWRCLAKENVNAEKLGLNNEQVESMRKQFVCHATNSVPSPRGPSGGPLWEVESWRSNNISESWARNSVLVHRCNW